MSLEQNLREMERTREHYWRSHPQSSPIKLHWRALTVRHCFQVLPSESILEIGAGGGLWTSELAQTFHGENPITACVFNPDLMKACEWNQLRNVHPILVESLSDLPPASFDYVVGTAILCHDRYPENLKEIYRLLKPGGQILFFENNLWNPQVLMKTLVPPIGRWTGNARSQIGMRKYNFLRIASHQSFTNIDVIPYDIIHPLLPKRIIPFVQSIAFVFEHAPLIKELCGSLYLWAKKPGGLPDRPVVNLAEHSLFEKAVSFVVPETISGRCLEEYSDSPGSLCRQRGDRAQATYCGLSHKRGTCFMDQSNCGDGILLFPHRESWSRLCIRLVGRATKRARTQT